MEKEKETKSLTPDNNMDRRDELFMKVNDIQPAKWIIEGLIAEQGLGILFGDWGKGKTTLAMQMLDALRTGNKLFGLETHPANCLLIEQDEPSRIFRNHRDRVVNELPSLSDMEIPKVFVEWDDQVGDFTNLVNLIRAYPAKLVIIDSFTSLGIPDINHPKTSAILGRLRKINDDEDCSILLLHHLNRRGEILGSVTIQTKADNLVELNDAGLNFHKTRGELKSIKDSSLPIKRQGKSIIFRLPMAERARMLLGNPRAKDILLKEYPGSNEHSITETLSRSIKRSNKA